MRSFLGRHGIGQEEHLGRNEVELAGNCWGFFFPMIGREVFKVEMFVLINLLLEKCFLYHKVFWTKGTGKAVSGAGV